MGFGPSQSHRGGLYQPKNASDWRKRCSQRDTFYSSTRAAFSGEEIVSRRCLCRHCLLRTNNPRCKNTEYARELSGVPSGKRKRSLRCAPPQLRRCNHRRNAHKFLRNKRKDDHWRSPLGDFGRSHDASCTLGCKRARFFA